MFVVCVEGCHGSGKTSLCDSMRERGLNVLDEAFIVDAPRRATLHPQSVLMETAWVVKWFERLLDKRRELDERGARADERVFVADRSPYSAAFYARTARRAEIRVLVREMVDELATHANIHVRTVHVRVQPAALWQRIADRLVREPHRESFRENERAWMDTVVAAYNAHSWDHQIDNDGATVHCAAARLFDIVNPAAATSVGQVVEERHAGDTCSGAPSCSAPLFSAGTGV